MYCDKKTASGLSSFLLSQIFWSARDAALNTVIFPIQKGHAEILVQKLRALKSGSRIVKFWLCFFNKIMKLEYFTILYVYKMQKVKLTINKKNWFEAKSSQSEVPMLSTYYMSLSTQSIRTLHLKSLALLFNLETFVQLCSTVQPTRFAGR